MTEHTPEAPDLDPVLKTGASKRNVEAANKALARIYELAWEPLAAYPGSDTHWRVRCILGCQENGNNWEGVMFYSHMRRARRHAGCLPKDIQAAAVEALAKARG
ncbi:hypothetical protein [Streptomyces sp. NRRL S-241]|uniref:hypothetical protein n=1 Tax=Streptomyces sp. NRRL S-241 TaxID=1463896 RepID=UPI0004C181D2|nr:hypothetical protein [Streptomyces sp. NRRL S-241]